MCSGRLQHALWRNSWISCEAFERSAPTPAVQPQRAFAVITPAYPHDHVLPVSLEFSTVVFFGCTGEAEAKRGIAPSPPPPQHSSGD